MGIIMNISFFFFHPKFLSKKIIEIDIMKMKRMKNLWKQFLVFGEHNKHSGKLKSVENHRILNTTNNNHVYSNLKHLNVEISTCDTNIKSIKTQNQFQYSKWLDRQESTN